MKLFKYILHFWHFKHNFSWANTLLLTLFCFNTSVLTKSTKLSQDHIKNVQFKGELKYFF